MTTLRRNISPWKYNRPVYAQQLGAISLCIWGKEKSYDVYTFIYIFCSFSSDSSSFYYAEEKEEEEGARLDLLGKMSLFK